MYIGSIDEKSPFVYTSVFWGFDETLILKLHFFVKIGSSDIFLSIFHFLLIFFLLVYVENKVEFKINNNIIMGFQVHTSSQATVTDSA